MPTHDSTVAVVSQIFPQGGYGFATAEDGRRIYFHQHVVGSHTFDELREGETVQLEFEQRGDDEHAHAVKLMRLCRTA